ncbi:KAP family NTPase [Maricaulaceae bacterium NA33B04]|nr:KAP family NTPase [Maricaulaceae bacterium NA33B04]
MAIRAEGGQEPLFHDAESFRAWLEGKPREWAAVLARRSALRAGGVLPGLLVDDTTKGAAFHAFRALFILHSTFNNNARVRAAYAYAYAYADAAYAYADAAYAYADAAAAYAYADAAYAYADAAAANAYADAAVYAYAAANAAANAANAAAAANVAAEGVWSQLSMDVRVLTSAGGADTLKERSLWSGTPPQSILTGFDTCRASDIAASSLSFWAVWYRTILLNKPTDPIIPDTIAVEIVLEKPAFWEKRDPKTVTADIARRARWDFKKRPIKPLLDVWPVWPEIDDNPKLHTRDTANTLCDDPTAEDTLGRSVFAAAVVERLDDIHSQMRKDKGEGGFALNLHAPWGAGKTSVLQMMERLLRSKDREPDERWIVVNFNAWRHERRKPPWFPLMDALQKQACIDIAENAQSARQYSVRGHWLSWRFLSDAMALFVGLAIVGAVAGVWWTTRNMDEFGPLLTIVSAVLGLAGGGFALSRTLVFGSDEHANFHLELTRDPLNRVTRVFRSIVEACNGKICIFIDDLDRCDGDYVVTFLEGIQTCFRHRDVVYVVAADRKWIKAAFEKRYGDTFQGIHKAGQPVGYMFLEKIFQMSLPLPAVSPDYRDAYYGTVLKDGTDPARAEEDIPDEVSLDEEREALRAERGEAGMTADDVERLKDQLDADETVTGADRARRVSAAVLESVKSSEAAREAEHRLLKVRHHAPFNPRVLKRMVNAYTLRLVELQLSDDEAMTRDGLARWVVLEQCYPGLADLLAEKPDRIEEITGERDNSAELSAVVTENTRRGFNRGNDPLTPFIGDPDIKAIATDLELGDPLTKDTVRLFTAGMR